MNPDSTLIEDLRSRIDGVLQPLLSSSKRVALLDFPAFSNVGDSAIWLGAVAYLRSVQRTLVYTCDLETLDEQTLTARIGTGPILLNGGGSLGDLWPRHQQFRERVLQTFPHNPIIQLPQSVHFRERGALARARSVFDHHARFTLLVRDHASLEVAKTEFRCTTLLCPDLALWLGVQPRPVEGRAVVWLLREDAEAVPREIPQDVAATRADWLGEPVTMTGMLERRLRQSRLGSKRGLRGTDSLLRVLQYRLARARLSRGFARLALSRAVVTDRLHGHILSVLLGVPHIVLDNSYGKLRSFYHTWTANSRLSWWANSLAEAAALVRTERTPDDLR